MTARKVAIVTGANRGIGLEIACQLARLGFATVIAARDAEKGRAAAAALGTDGLDIEAVTIDVDDGGSVEKGIADVVSRLGRVDVLVNNAGVLLDGPEANSASVLDVPVERMLASFRTNTVGALLTMQQVLPVMRKNGYGRIVNISSRAGQLEELRRGFPSYRISKTALNSLTRVAAAEFAGENIKINVMCPGWVRTGMGGAHAPLSVAEGAETAVWLATLADDGPTGRFFRQKQSLSW